MSILVSVIMTVYNGEEFLQAAIDGILQQTYTDFELIVVNNGSVDGTEVLLQQLDDQRIEIIKLVENVDRTAALNLALAHAKGDYIAIHDADDLSMSTRLQKQVDFLEQNKEIIVLGTWSYLIDEFDYIIGKQEPPTRHQVIIDSFTRYYYSPFAHSSVMFRRTPVIETGGYPEKCIYSQDFALWVKLSTSYQFANLPDKLVAIRSHMAQATRTDYMAKSRYQENLSTYQDVYNHPTISEGCKREAKSTLIKIKFDYARYLAQHNSLKEAVCYLSTIWGETPLVGIRHLLRESLLDIAQSFIGSRGRFVFNFLRRSGKIYEIEDSDLR